MRRDIVLASSIALVAACGAARADGPVDIAGAVEVEVGLVARSQAFEPTELHVPSDTPVAIRFENTDIGVGHALVIDRLGVLPTRIASAAPTVGPDVETYALRELPVGDYRISCAIHPQMVASLSAS